MLSYRKLAMRVLGRPLHTGGGGGGGIDSPRPASQRAAAFILTAAMLTTLAAPAFADTWCIENGDITVKAGDTKGTNKVSQGSIIDKVDTNTVITNNNKNTASSNTVTIEAKDKDDKVEVKLDNVNIDTSKQNKAAVSVTGSGNTTIELDGSNTLKSGNGYAGLEHNKTDTSGELTIQDNDKNGSLKAAGGKYGAGIGGAGAANDAQVKITGGKITATGGEYGAGIGGGFKGSGDVTISGGEIHANGGNYGAGIGGGDYSSGKVTISGGEINATGGYLGAGIGGGEKGSGDVTITGGEITSATGGKYGAGIGGGEYSSGKVTIEGNTEVNAAGGTGGAGIGGGSTGGGSAGGDSAGGDSTGGGSTGGDSADASVQESVFPGLVVTDKDGQRTSYTSIRGNNILSLRVGRFTASFRISLSTLRQLRAEGIETITFQTILCSTTLSVDELLAMGGEDTPVALAHSMGTARLTVGGEDHSELLK